jgi:hypothetical protein
MLTAIAMGAAQGVQHSFEPDHLAAVTVLVGEQRDPRRAAWLGAIWGVGHTASLLAFGVALAAVGAAVPPVADVAFTLAVAAMLVLLGGRALWPRAPASEAPRPHRIRSPLQALAVGALHGLAGSSALAAALFASLPDTGARVVYMALFGVGSIAGMAAVSGTAGLWLRAIARPWLLAALRSGVALASIGLGAAMAIRALTG